MSRFRLFARLSAGFLASVLLAGCGGGSGSGGGSNPSPTPVSVAISPSAITLAGGATQTFVASVSNDAASAGVTWTASTGAITTGGIYTAPAIVTSTSATVTATSKTDVTKSASAAITLTLATAPISLSVLPAVTTLVSGATQTFAATVNGDATNSGVTWTASVGLISAAGVYTAPSPVATSTATITATSKSDPTKTAPATVTLTPISASVSPATLTLIGGATQAFVATITGDNTLNQGVTWAASTGTITSGGNYTAPALVTTTLATVTASSRTDPKKIASATITLMPISDFINPVSPVPMIGGATQTLIATVLGDGSNSGVIWTASGGGSFSPATTLTGVATTYTAPTPVISATATLTATSVKDPAKSASVTVLLTQISLNTISPASASLGSSGSQAFTETVANDSSNSGVSWSIAPAVGALTSSSSTGVTYIAPTTAISAVTTVILTATSTRDPARSTASTITLNPISVSVSPTSPPAMIGAAVQPLIATVTSDGSNSGVTWTVTGGGSFSAASTASGIATTYTAASQIAGATAVVTATSVKDPSKSASATITLTPIAVSFSSATTGVTLDSGQTMALIAAVANDSSASGITFTPSGAGSVNPTSASGNSPATTLTADGTVASTVTVTATSNADPARSATTSSITVNPPFTFTSIAGGLPLGTVGIPYPSTSILSVSGGTGARTFAIASGTLPDGLLLSPTTGSINGTPTGSTAISTFSLKVTDIATTPVTLTSGTFTITINAMPLVWASPTGGTLTYTVGTPITPITLSATGGTAPVTYSINAGSLPAGLAITANQITGTPTAPTLVAGNVIGFLATDSTTPAPQTAVSPTLTFIVNIAPLALPAPNPASLGPAGIGANYIGTINAIGGVPGYTWTVNSSPVPSDGSTLGLSSGLSVSNSGGSNSLSVTGTPNALGTVTFSATVQDSAGTIVGPLTYTVNVSNLYAVGGQINSKVGCNTSGLVGVTVSINTNPVQTTTTSSNGSFSFSNVPNGTYTITPSISGSSSAFYPATQIVTVNSNNLTTTSVSATLGYTVTGTVAYTGTQSGSIYLALNPTSSCGGGSTGTSVSSAGAFTIRGVPPGTYTLQAFMDNQGAGVPNAANPIGSTGGVSVTTANLTGVSLALNDPASVILSTAPTLKAVSGFDKGALIEYNPIVDISGVEMATYYDLQWSSTSTFTTFANKQFRANGTHSNLWLLNSGLVNGNTYYFRAYGTSGGTLVGPSSLAIGPVTIGPPTGGNTVTGSVSFTSTAAGPLYTGFLDQVTGAFYGAYFASPAATQAYAVQVPTGSAYLFVGVVDQNNDGAINANDITNTGNGSSQPITVISGDTSNQNLTLPGTNGIATVTTQNFESITPGGSSSQNFSLNFRVNGLIKQPVAATLSSGPNLISPVDIAICGGTDSRCGQGFQISFNLNSTSPGLDDAYSFNVTYSDGTTGILTAKVTALLNAFASSLAPTTGTSAGTTPAFTWADPTNPAIYTYQFYMNDPTGKIVWQIPGGTSNSIGLSSATTSLTWGIDPTDSSNHPSSPTLTPGTIYDWQIQVQDSYGNSAVTQVQYQP